MIAIRSAVFRILFAAVWAVASLQAEPVPQPPKIVLAPQSVTAIVGDTTAFTVAALGDGPLSYQWLKDEAALPDATNSALVLTNVQLTDAGAYAVVVTNLAGSATSAAAVLTVTPPPKAPTLLIQPLSQTIQAGGNAEFAAEADGTAPLNYQWYKDAVALPGATNVPLILTNAQLADAGGYFVVVANVAGSATSLVATLTVTIPPTPPSFTRQPIGQTLAAGLTLTLSAEAAGSEPLGYQWYKDGTPLAGQTNVVLTVNRAQTTDSGLYTLLVSNSGGAVPSSPAVVVVYPPGQPPATQLILDNIRQVSARQAAVDVLLAAAGLESYVAFSLNFNPQILTEPEGRLPLPGTNPVPALSLESSLATNGMLGVTVAQASGVAFASGRQVLCTLLFTLTNTTPADTTQPLASARFAFGDTPLLRIVRDTANNELVQSAPEVQPMRQADPPSTAASRQTGLMSRTLRVTNPGAGLLPGAQLRIRGLTNDTLGNPVTLFNASGVVGGIPYVQVPPLAAGASLALLLEFYVSDRRTLPEPVYEWVLAAPVSPPLDTATAVQADLRQVEGLFLVEFVTATNRVYYIQYTDSLAQPSWLTSLPPVQGTGERAQWLDTGLPRTLSQPDTNRFYRVLVSP
jgi:hypothetical protein